MTYFISEILKLVGDEKTDRTKKIQILQKNATPQLKTILRCLIDPDIQFFTDKLPPHRPDDAPLGLNGNSLHLVSRMFYVWLKQNPIPDSKKEKILIQHLESLHKDECDVFLMILMKKFPKGINEGLILQAFPAILHDSQVHRLLRINPSTKIVETKIIEQPKIVEIVKPVVVKEKKKRNPRKKKDVKVSNQVA